MARRIASTVGGQPVATTDSTSAAVTPVHQQRSKGSITNQGSRAGGTGQPVVPPGAASTMAAMPLATADCQCVACQGHFRVDAVHRGRRVACPHCLAEQLPQVLPGGGTGRVAKPSSQVMGAPPTTLVDPASLALFICRGCGFRARVPATTTTVPCPRCGVVGPATRTGIPPASGTTVVLTKPDHPSYSSNRLPAATPATPKAVEPAPTGTPHQVLVTRLLLAGALVLLAAAGVGLLALQREVDWQRDLVSSTRKELSEVKSDLERVRADNAALRASATEAAAKATPAPAAESAAPAPVTADPGTPTTR